MKTLELSDLKLGMQVVFVDESLNIQGPGDVYIHETNSAKFAGKLAMVVAINGQDKNPGKAVGICFKEDVKGHSCDNLVPHGHGAWVLPEMLYTAEEYSKHKANGADVRAARKVVAKMLEQFIASK